MEDQNYEVRKEMETYPVKGEAITIEANVTYCNVCGEQIWDQELDDENLVKAFRLYREKNNLLQPEEIKNIREKYGLSQMAFAQILGLGDKTIARYETGSLQDAAPNTLISLSKYPNVFKDIVETNKVRISDTLYQSVLERLSEFETRVIHGGEIIPYKTKANHYFMEGAMGSCAMYGGLRNDYAG
jgi:putative zinc finger/helix-turn-helix YgiT family protein